MIPVVAVETVLMGRCVNPDCKRAFRITVPLTFGFPGRVWHANLLAAGVEAPLCDCNEHGRGAVDWRPLAVEINPEVACPIGAGKCWSAKSSKCVCSCGGVNHGRHYEITRSI